jgi:tetratricopeptide (TPR) repeat protein
MKAILINKALFFGLVLVLLLSCKQPERNYPMIEPPVAGTEFFQAGIAEVERQVRSNPANPDVHYKKALYHQALGQIDEALAAVKKAISLDPTPEYLFTEAALLYEKHQYELALARISRAQILGGDDPDLWYLMAELNYLTGNYQTALDEIELAVSKYPEAMKYYCTRGKIQWALNDTVNAFNSFTKSIDDVASSYQALKYLAVISRSQGDYRKAFSFLDRNLSQHTLDRDLLMEKGSLYAEVNQNDSALIIFHKIRDIDSTDWEPLYELALVHFQRRRYDSTLYYTDEILEMNQQHLPSILTQARVYDRRTYYGTAMRKYQEILDIDSTYTPAVEELAKLRGKVAYLQKIQKAREANSKVEIISPTKPPVRN